MLKKRKVIVQMREKHTVTNEKLKKCSSLSNGKILKDNGERTNDYKKKEGR